MQYKWKTRHTITINLEMQMVKKLLKEKLKINHNGGEGITQLQYTKQSIKECKTLNAMLILSWLVPT